jgi:DNA polymerase III subunit gamma/tau
LPTTETQATSTPAKEEPKQEFKKSKIQIPKLNSLKEEFNAPPKQEEKVEVDTSVRNTFSISELKSYWNEYALSLKKQKRENEYLILINRELELDENFNIKIKLDNGVQLDQLNSFKGELVDYLRKSLKNNLILVESSLSAVETKKIIYTSDDKLKHLLQKYPVIDELKKRLGLETDF